MTIQRFDFCADNDEPNVQMVPDEAGYWCQHVEVADLEARHRETLDALAQSQAQCRELKADREWCQRSLSGAEEKRMADVIRALIGSESPEVVARSVFNNWRGMRFPVLTVNEMPPAPKETL